MEGLTKKQRCFQKEVKEKIKGIRQNKKERQKKSSKEKKKCKLIKVKKDENKNLTQKKNQMIGR